MASMKEKPRQRIPLIEIAVVAAIGLFAFGVVAWLIYAAVDSLSSIRLG